MSRRSTPRCLPWCLLAAVLLLVPGLSAATPTRDGGARELVGAPLEVGLNASPSEGSAPLTVTFEAVASGGSGNYSSFAWTLGNGDTGAGTRFEYTYAKPGTFLVTVAVTDSTGARATAQATVYVDPRTATSGSAAPPLAPIGEAAAGGALLGAVLTFFVLRGSPGGALAPARRREEPVPIGAGADPARADVVREVGEPKAAVPEETLRLSERVILHLARLPALTPQDVGSVERTQSGMAEKFEASQGAVSSIMMRLAAAGVVSESKRHVRDFPRRVKVYELTPYGLRLAAALRTEKGPSKR